LVFIVNGLASAGSIGNLQTGEISAKYETYITPAGYAFSIWGLIYFFLAWWGVYQLLPSTKQSQPINAGIGHIFLVNAVANVAWIFVWQYELIYLSLIIMLVILYTLALIYFNSQDFTPAASYVEYLSTQLGFRLYLGWIIAASIVNLYCASTNIVDPKFISAGVVGLVIGLLIEGGAGAYNLDPVLPGVGCWAITAIAIKQKAVPQVYSAAVVCAGLLGVECAVLFGWNMLQIYRGKRSGWSSAVKTNTSSLA
jgi:hypothetical protein